MLRLCFAVALVAAADAIVGGYDAAPGAWPWFVAVYQTNDRFVAGGVLVNGNKVLTSASVVGDYDGGYYVVLGMTDIANTSNTQKIGVEKVVPHPDYGSVLRNNIAMLYLKERPAKTDAVEKIPRIATRQTDKTLEETDNPTCVTLGLGYLISGGKWIEPTHLQELYVDPIDNDRCSFLFGITAGPYNICTYSKKKRGICFADFGGPLACYLDNVWTLVGLIANINRYDGCLTGTMMYTRASVFKEWINQ